MPNDLSLFGDDEPDVPPPTPSPPAEPQLAGWLVDSLRKALDARGLVSMDERQRAIEEAAGRPVRSLRDLTRGEAMQILTRLTPQQDQPGGSSWDDREDDTWIDRLQAASNSTDGGLAAVPRWSVPRSGVRIGTWNMAGWKKPGWQQFLLDGNCEVWLLTEVNQDIVLPGFERHLGTTTMAARRRWAGVYSRRPLVPLPDPHRASAAAVIDGVTYCSTILPWTSNGGEPNWPGGESPDGQHAGRTAHALEVLRSQLPAESLVWGGDWNHALNGPEGAGSMGGRRHVLSAVGELGLKVPTSWLPHRLGKLSIDHVAVPTAWSVRAAQHRTVTGLSDHDCYVVDVIPR